MPSGRLAARSVRPDRLRRPRPRQQQWPENVRCRRRWYSRGSRPGLSGDVYSASEAKQVQSVTYGTIVHTRAVQIQSGDGYAARDRASSSGQRTSGAAADGIPEEAAQNRAANP
jgi:hypothetical protein